MASEFMTWLSEILASFDGSDFIAFIGGCVAMIIWKNVKCMAINRDKTDKRRFNLPKMNTKYLIWVVVIISILGVFWSTNETSRAQHALATQTHAIAVRTCEDSKVSSIERNGLQGLLLNLLNPPAEIKVLPQTDPRRQEYGRKLSLDYLGLLDEAGQARRAIRDGGHLQPGIWDKYMGSQVEPKCD
jgi:hypothetical protein